MYLEALKQIKKIHRNHENKTEAKKEALKFLNNECKKVWSMPETMLRRLRRIPADWGPRKPAVIEIQLFASDENETPEEAEKQGSEGYAEAVRAMQEKATGKWGWCTAVIQVIVKDAEGKINGSGCAFLDNCSYESAEDFIKSGYLTSMVNDAIDNIDI